MLLQRFNSSPTRPGLEAKNSYQSSHENPFTILEEPYRPPSSHRGTPLNSYYSSSPLMMSFSHRSTKNSSVFERLIRDTNKRFDRELKLNELKTNKELKQQKKFSENEAVYNRLHIDTQLRREHADLRESYKQKLALATANKSKSTKKLPSTQVNAITNRLLSTNYIESTNKTIEKQYELMKTLTKSSSLTFNPLHKTPSTPTLNQKPLKSRTTLIERMEIEQLYGKPGSPTLIKPSIPRKKPSIKPNSPSTLSNTLSRSPYPIS